MEVFSLTVIIPTLNEAGSIAATIDHVRAGSKSAPIELIVADGGSTDDTCSIAIRCGATIVQSAKGRAIQMNAGASIANGSVLYFLHADTLPPDDYYENIKQSFQKGYQCGSFRLKFDMNHWFLNANCWFTRFNWSAFRFGDQSLFVSTSVFRKSGGFNETLIVLEDQEIIPRLKKHGAFSVMKNAVTTSSRKYRENGVFRTQAVFYLIYLQYCLGFSQQQLLNTYRSFIKQDKL